MTTKVIYNPREGSFEITVRGIPVISTDYDIIAEIAEKTIQDNIEAYFKIKERVENNEQKM